MVSFGRVGLTVSSNVVGFGRLGPAGHAYETQRGSLPDSYKRRKGPGVTQYMVNGYLPGLVEE